MLYLLDYGAGNVRSLANSIRKLGYDFEWVKSPEDFKHATKLLFPGVGAFGSAMESLRRQGYDEPLKEYIASGRPYMGICIGMQALFESSAEAPGVKGLGVVPGTVGKFDGADGKKVPHMGWNRAKAVRKGASQYGLSEDAQGSQSQHYYFVHSYRVGYDPSIHKDCALSTTQYGHEVYLSSVQQGNVFATQFHPEKSGRAGLELLRAWLSQKEGAPAPTGEWLLDPMEAASPDPSRDGLTKRIVACLDVRSNDAGDLVVTKGESYDVREKDNAAATTSAGGEVRNLGKPVDLAMRYYLEGADEVTFLNITSFRSSALKDQPMLAMLELAAATIFVPLTIGGGIKDSTDPDGTVHSAVEVAEAYFRAGADKVSIGSEAVLAVEALLASLPKGQYDPRLAPKSALTGKTGIESIARAYGNQAVVVSIDPRRVYLEPGAAVPPAHAWSLCKDEKEEGGRSWWYACTIKGGRETRDVDVVQLARGVELLGAGELLINSIDADGQGQGFDRHLIELVRRYTGVPAIASSGAGRPSHFTDIFAPSSGQGSGSVEAALAAGIFHRREVAIDEVKAECERAGLEIRRERLDMGASAAVLADKGDKIEAGEREPVQAA